MSRSLNFLEGRICGNNERNLNESRALRRLLFAELLLRVAGGLGHGVCFERDEPEKQAGDRPVVFLGSKS